MSDGVNIKYDQPTRSEVRQPSDNLLPKFEVNWINNTPRSIRIDDREEQIIVATSTKSSVREFWKPAKESVNLGTYGSKILKADPILPEHITGNTIFWVLVNNLSNNVLSVKRQSEEYEYSMAGRNSPIYPAGKDPLQSEASKEAHKQVEEWIEDLRKRNIPLTFQTIKTEGGTTIDFIRLGQTGFNNPKQEWDSAMEILEAVKVLSQAMGIRSDRRILALEGNDFTKSRLGENRLIDKLQDIHGISGATEKNVVLFFNTARATLENDQPETKINTNWQRRTIWHEIGHLLDDNLRIAPSPLIEGFAIACEVRFNFNRIKAILRHSGYGRDITSGQIKHLFSEEVNTQESVPVSEKYDVTGSFLCQVAEELGIKKMLELCQLLAQGKLEHTPDNLISKYKGNLVNSLELVGRNISDFSPENFIAEYLERINNKDMNPKLL